MMKMTLVRPVKSPTRATEGSCGFDFYIPNENLNLTIEPHKSLLIASGVKVEIPQGYALIGHNKSSIAKLGLLIGANVIDSDYQGEIHINLWNVTDQPITLQPNQKVVQFILMPVNLEPFIIVMEDEMYQVKTERGTGGFGSTNDKEIPPISLTDTYNI